MNSKKLFIILSLMITSQTNAMKRFSQNLSSNKTSSKPLVKSPFLFRSKAFGVNACFFPKTPKSIYRQIALQNPKRMFSTSQPKFEIWNNFAWNFKSPERRKMELFTALKHKIVYSNSNFKSDFFPEASLKKLIEKIREESFINETRIAPYDNYPNYKWTPLQVAVHAGKYHVNQKDMEAALKILKENGADLYDPSALKMAIAEGSIHALNIIVPQFSWMELLPEFVNARKNLQRPNTLNIMKNYNTEKVLLALNKPFTKQTFSKIVCNGDESYEQTFEASNCEEIYKILYDAEYSYAEFLDEYMNFYQS